MIFLIAHDCVEQCYSLVITNDKNNIKKTKKISLKPQKVNLLG